MFSPTNAIRKLLIITEILETHHSSTRTTVEAEVHPIPSDIPADIDLEIKLEQVEEEGDKNEGQHEEGQSDSERAAAALLLLSQPKSEPLPQQADLWEGNIL